MVQGVIGRVNDKQWNGKTFYSLALNGQDGWYNTGVKKPPTIGTSVRFNEKTNAKGYKEVDGSIEILADGAAGPAGAVGTVAKAAIAGDGGKSAYWLGKETRDLTNDAARELGASRNTAIAIIDLALKNEVVKLPAPAKREEFLWTLINKYAARLMGKDEKSTTDSAETGEADKGSLTSTNPNTDDVDWN